MDKGEEENKHAQRWRPQQRLRRSSARAKHRSPGFERKHTSMEGRPAAAPRSDGPLLFPLTMPARHVRRPLRWFGLCFALCAKSEDDGARARAYNSLLSSEFKIFGKLVTTFGKLMTIYVFHYYLRPYYLRTVWAVLLIQLRRLQQAPARPPNCPSRPTCHWAQLLAQESKHQPPTHCQCRPAAVQAKAHMHPPQGRFPLAGSQ
eukprot:932499-Pleurochrysis_carterae.AAC.1